MIFRLGFFGPFFVDASLFIIQLSAFGMIYSNIDSIGGWGQGEMIIFIGTYLLINGLNMVIYFFGVISIPEKIKSGELDLYQTKPVNPLLRLSFEQINPGSLPLIPLSIAIICYGAFVSQAKITAAPAVERGKPGVVGIVYIVSRFLTGLLSAVPAAIPARCYFLAGQGLKICLHCFLYHCYHIGRG